MRVCAYLCEFVCPCVSVFANFLICVCDLKHSRCVVVAMKTLRCDLYYLFFVRNGEMI